MAATTTGTATADAQEAAGGPGAQHGLVAHGHGAGTVPASSRAERTASFDVADFPMPGGREEEWRFTPIAPPVTASCKSADSSFPARMLAKSPCLRQPVLRYEASVLMLVQSSDGLRWVPLSLKPNPQRQPAPRALDRRRPAARTRAAPPPPPAPPRRRRPHRS